MTSRARLLISAALLGWIAWQTDWAQVGDAFARLHPGRWLAAAGLLAAAQVVSAVRWRQMAAALGLHRPLPRMLGFYFIGMYFNLLLPTSVGGDVVRAWYLDGGTGQKGRAFLSVLLDRLCGLYVLLALACLGVLLAPGPLPGWMAAGVWGCAAIAALALAALPLLFRHADHAPGKVRRALHALRAAPAARVLLWPTALSVLVQAANVVIVWLLGEAIGAQVPASFYWVLVPMTSLLTMLPVSVNGMGVREGVMVVMLAPVGVGQGAALTLAFLWFAVTAVVSLAGGLVYLFGRFPRPVVSAAVSEEVEAHDGPVGGDSGQGRAGQFEAAA